MTPEVMLDRLHLLQSIVAGMIAEVKSAQLIRELNEPDHADLLKPAPFAEYMSDVPHGYDTVLGYLAKLDPQMLRNMADVCEGTRRDGFWLTARAGYDVVSVEAPQVLKQRGIERVNAYSIDLLERRFGELPVFVTNTPRPGDKPGSRPTWEERERDRENNGGHY